MASGLLFHIEVRASKFMNTSPPLAAVEAGGTKFICAMSNREGRILRQANFSTSDPEHTFAKLAEFFENGKRDFGRPTGAGIATFGPVQLDPSKPKYGCIESTPKPGWSGADIRSAVARATGAPVMMETDVNGAALGEGVSGGAAHDVQDFAYVTIGTGIGVGIVAGGKVRTTYPHTEMGHVRVPRAPGDSFPGVCPYHSDCLEGLASGTSMAARWGQPARNLTKNHEAWTMASHYAAALCVNLSYAFRPQRIVLGGGVMTPPFMIERIREAFRSMMADYAPGPFASDPKSYLVTPRHVDPSPAIVGALSMARRMSLSTR